MKTFLSAALLLTACGSVDTAPAEQHALRAASEVSATAGRVAVPARSAELAVERWPIAHGTAEEIASLVNELIEAARRAPPRCPRGDVMGPTGALVHCDFTCHVAADDATNTVIGFVHAEDVPRIGELIRRLDVEIAR